MAFSKTLTQLRSLLKHRSAQAVQIYDDALVIRSDKDFYCAFPNFGDRVHLVEDFNRCPGLNADIQNAAESVRMIVNLDFEVLGVNMTSALATFDAEGGLRLTTAGADADSSILLPHLDTKQTKWTGTTWGTDRETEWGALVRPRQITACKIWSGLKLTNTPVNTTDADEAFFKFDSAHATLPTKWVAVYDVGNAGPTEIDTGVTVAADQLYSLRIIIDAARVARFYIDGKLVATSTALTNAVDLIPYNGVIATAAAAKAVTILKQAIGRKAA